MDDSYHGECLGTVRSAPPATGSLTLVATVTANRCQPSSVHGWQPSSAPVQLLAASPTYHVPCTSRCLRGFWEDGRPVAPFSSREYGSGYAFASVQLGYVANHDDPAVHGALSVRRSAAT